MQDTGKVSYPLIHYSLAFIGIGSTSKTGNASNWYEISEVFLRIKAVLPTSWYNSASTTRTLHASGNQDGLLLLIGL